MQLVTITDLKTYNNDVVLLYIYNIFVNALNTDIGKHYVTVLLDPMYESIVTSFIKELFTNSINDPAELSVFNDKVRFVYFKESGDVLINVIVS